MPIIATGSVNSGDGVSREMSRADDPVLVESDERGILRLTLNRPEARNAINWAMRRELERLLREAAVDPQVRVVVLAGDDRAFCAGGDLKEPGRTAADVTAKLEMAKIIVTQITTMMKPVVAEVRGYASGAGVGLALACDLVLVDDTAVFTFPFLARGLVPDVGTAFWLSRQLGPLRAKDLLLTGREVRAREAVDWGLAARAWSAEEFRIEADRLEAALADAAPVTFGLTKDMVNRACDWELSAALDAEILAQVEVLRPVLEDPATPDNG